MASTALTVERQRALEFGDISSLSAKFQGYPILSADEERNLVQRMHQDNDREAAQQLILSHMRYVISVAKSYLSYGLPARDIVQEGTVGLMKAVRNFELSHGVRLVTYAAHWIKAEIHEYLLKNWRLVKIATTKAQRKLFFNLNKYKKNFTWLTQEETAQIAADLNVPEREVRAMELRLAQPEDTYEETYDDQEGTPVGPGYKLSYDGDNPSDLVCQDKHQALLQQQLGPALAALTEREQDIITARWLSDKKAPLKDLAAKFEVSIERVRQIESKAMAKLKAALDPAACACGI